MGTYYQFHNLTKNERVDPSDIGTGYQKASEMELNSEPAKVLAFVMLRRWHHDHVVIRGDAVFWTEGVTDVTKAVIDEWNQAYAEPFPEEHIEYGGPS
jgi:hypothetical protein